MYVRNLQCIRCLLPTGSSPSQRGCPCQRRCMLPHSLAPFTVPAQQTRTSFSVVTYTTVLGSTLELPWTYPCFQGLSLRTRSAAPLVMPAWPGKLLHGNAISPAIIVIAHPPVRALRPLCVRAPSRRRMQRRRCMLGPLGPAFTRLRSHIGSLAVIAFSPVVPCWLLCCVGARGGRPTRRKTLDGCQVRYFGAGKKPAGAALDGEARSEGSGMAVSVDACANQPAVIATGSAAACPLPFGQPPRTPAEGPPA